MRGNLLAHLNRVVIEGYRGLGERVKRQDEGSRTDFKNFRVSIHNSKYTPGSICISSTFFIHHSKLRTSFFGKFFPP